MAGQDLHQWPRTYGYWTKIGPASTSNKLDGGVPASYTTVFYRNSPKSVLAGQLQLAYLQMQNRSGVTNICGCGVRFGTPSWSAGQWTDAATFGTYADTTTAAQSFSNDTGYSDFALETSTVRDGFMVGALAPFSCIAINVSSASATGVGTARRELAYTTASGWSTLSGAFVGPPDTANYATGETLIWFPTPTDWATGSAALHATLSGITSALFAQNYWIRVRATQAPSTVSGTAHSLSVHDLPFTIDAIANNIIYEPALGGMYYPFSEYGECLVAAWATSSASNTITAIVRGRG